MKTITLSSIVVSLLLVTGCGSSSSTQPTANTAQPTNSTVQPTTAGTIDITNALLSNRSANCEAYVNRYQSMVKDVINNTDFQGSLDISVQNGKCYFSSNSIPNYDFNDGSGHFATRVSAQNINYEMTASPIKASSTTALSLQYDNAIILNGVKVDILAAACYGVGDEKIGCFDINTPWRLDPMSPLTQFGEDSHHAHTQPTGEYHYHGSPEALFDTAGSAESPVIGFAADGFPIYGPYISVDGKIRKATSSYQLKSGSREAIKGVNPGGSYDGTYRDDYEYIAGEGDLDECNGMTKDGVYGYYVTESYPWMIGCYKGTPDNSFRK